VSVAGLKVKLPRHPHTAATFFFLSLPPSAVNLDSTVNMPLDTSTYSLALLRVDGRRWNDLRRLQAQIRTQNAADGSSYLEMGNTKVMCVVTGPSEGRGRGTGPQNSASVVVNMIVAGFSSVDRKRRGRNDK
jgi:exosome complex component RRP41